MTTDGEYYLRKIVDGEWADTDPVRATTSQYVEQDSAKNTLRLLAEGSTISLYINGVRVAIVTDDSIADGRIGVFAGTGDNDLAEVLFSQMTILTVEKAKADWSTS